MLEMLLLGLLSIIIGFSIGLMGIGGVFLTPLLILLLDMHISTAMGTALFSFIGTGLLGSYFYSREGNVNWPAGLIMGLSSSWRGSD